jgi:Flp pilus assembly protein TadD
MNRAVAMSAASALCLILAAGCASSGAQVPKAAAQTVPAKPADPAPTANSDAATLAKDLPTTLDGEIQRAQLLRKKGDYDEAAHSLAQLMLVAPDDARVVGEYGKVLEQQGHSRDALAFLKRAVELQPSDWSLHSALGIAYDQIDDHASAKIAYERALALKPGDASVLNNYAVSRMLAGDYASAKRLFARAEAEGVVNPKIAGNIDKLAALRPDTAEPAAPAAIATAKPTPSPQPDAKVTLSVNATAPTQHLIARSANTGTGASAPSFAATAATTAQVSQTGPNRARTASAAPNALGTAATTPPVPAASLAKGQAMASSAAAPKPQSAQPGDRVALGPPKALAPQVVMERIPVDPLAGPVMASTASKAPGRGMTMQPVPVVSIAKGQAMASSTAAPKAQPGDRVALGAPKAALTPQVVMERVPFDPLAGPVKRTSSAKLATAAVHAAKPAATKPAEPATPDLRTAADAN